jgi:hypothetical protein
MGERYVKSYFSQLHLSPFLYESIKKGLYPMSYFGKGCLAKKK